jgi:hypothetical protein
MTLSVTRPAPEVPPRSHRAPESRGSAASRWVRADPVRAAALAMVAFAVAWRADIALGGYLVHDDWVLASYAAGSPLSSDYLLLLFNDHLMPAGMLIEWFMARTAELTYWPYVVLLLTGEAVLGITFYRLMRDLMPPGWGVLVPLAVLLFSPLTLDITAFWATGVQLLPTQLALVFTLTAQLKLIRTGQKRHLVTLGLGFAFGLLFFEKAILAAPLAFLFTACVFATGGPLRSAWHALKRQWPAWVLLGAMSAAYLWLYLSRNDNVRADAPIGGAATFVRQLVGDTLVPGLVGGPWRWFPTGDGAPLADPNAHATRWMAWFLFLALVTVTVALRPRAARAWALLAGYVALTAVMVALARAGTPIGGIAGLTTRYVSDALVVAALCIGIACFGVREWPPARPVRGLSPPVAVAGAVASAGLAVALLLGTVLSTNGFATAWSHKQGRDFLRTATADLAKAPPDAVFLDRPVPDGVVWHLFAPYNLQSYFFRPLSSGPEFVAEAESPYFIDDTGHVQRAAIGGTTTVPGPVAGCGHRADGGITSQFALTAPIYKWNWYVQIAYLSSGDSAAVFQLGDALYWFDLQPGLHELFFPIEGGGDAVQLTVAEKGVTVCVDKVVVGSLAPRQ